MTATSQNCHIKRVVPSYFPLADKRFEGRNIVFHTRDNQYLPCMVSDFTGFIVGMVGNEKFTMVIEGKWLTVQLRCNGYRDHAVCPDVYDGLNPEYISSGVDRKDALYGLIEKISEKILSGM
jgi:hypothetical protein